MSGSSLVQARTHERTIQRQSVLVEPGEKLHYRIPARGIPRSPGTLLIGDDPPERRAHDQGFGDWLWIRPHHQAVGGCFSRRANHRPGFKPGATGERRALLRRSWEYHVPAIRLLFRLALPWFGIRCDDRRRSFFASSQAGG